MSWKVFAQILKEVLHSVRSRSSIEHLADVLPIDLVLLLRVELEGWRLDLLSFSSSKELICQPSLCLLLEEQALLSSCHTLGVYYYLSSSNRSSSQLGLSLLEDLVIINFVGLLNATIFLGLKSILSCLFFLLFGHFFRINLILIVEFG